MRRHDTADPCRVPAIAALLLVAGAVGCGNDGTHAVSGAVTFDGQPVEDGYITFRSEDARVAPEATRLERGKYWLRATAGKKRVEIKASRFIGPENPVMGLRPREQFVPSRYNSETTLEAEVTAGGDNRFDFALESAAD